MKLSPCIEWQFADEHPDMADRGALGLEYRPTRPTLQSLDDTRAALGL